MRRLSISIMLVLLWAAFCQAQNRAAGRAANYPASRHGGPYMYNYYIPPAPGTTPWAPCWSPDGKWLAVAMQGSVWKVDPRTGDATELTHTAPYASSPAWSPDGKWIVYTADYNGDRIQLEIVDVASGESHALTDDLHIYLDPAFSPDGTRLAYVSTVPNGYFNVYVRGIRGGQWDGEPVAVTRDRQYPRDRLYFGPWDMHTQPVWTRDGKELIFVSNHGVPLGSGDLWRAPAKADGMLEAKRTPLDQTLYRTRPDVSPDGKRLIYSSFAGGADQFNNLYLLPLDGGAPYKLTFGNWDHFHPRWSPDGEWIAYISNKEGLPQLHVLETWGGADRQIRIRQRTWRRAMGKLHIRILDAATKLPTAARVHALAADGRHYAPPDTLARITGTGRHYFHTAGEVTLDVAPGKMTVEAVKGFEYKPGAQEVEIHEGRTASATLTLQRIVDMPARNWHSGSTHVHMNYGGNLHNTPLNLARMAAAEDLHVVNAMAANKDNRVLDWQYFRPNRQEYPLEAPVPGVRILFSQEYRPAFHGHSFLLGLRDHLVSPFTSNYEGTALDSLYPTNSDIFRKARAQGAITGYVHPSLSPSPLAVDAALGTVDALEWSGAVVEELNIWHRFLNNDVRLAPVGGEDSILDSHRLNRALGASRTYVHVTAPVNAGRWLEGIREGHTFFTSGPLLELRVNGALPGDAVKLPPGGGLVTVEGAVWSVGPLSKVTLQHRRGVLREIPLNTGRNGARFSERIQLKESDWITLEVQGPASPYFDADSALAATNAVRVYAGDGKIRDRESAEFFIGWIDALKLRTERWLWWNSEAEKKHVLDQYEEARRVYQGFVSEAR